MYKRLCGFLASILFFTTFFIVPILADDKQVVIDFFYGNTCLHCEKQKVFLEQLELEHEGVVVNYHEVFDSEENLELMKYQADRLGIIVKSVPFTIIDDHYFIGYSEGYTNIKILEIVNNAIDDSENNDIKLKLPLIGTINANDLPLPVLTVVLGIADGFNPCAMWVLLFLISLLINTQDRKRLWILGMTFILTSAIIYYLFMAAWLNVALFISTIFWLRLIVACVALIGGGYNLKKAIFKKGDGCEVVNEKQRDRVFAKIRKFTQEHNYALAIIGIVGLAITINMIELLCSAGLPVIYTQILTLNQLSNTSYYLYLLVYVLFFMLDDIIVFSIAILTRKLTGISTRFMRVTNIVGALIMIIIGLLLIFNPAALMFV
ncbi:MAG: hypothetical protein VB009_07670 [Erysipelotrichaceae bacterium]|nr:hypothetical protein [Erysipelotrichaceae bacterium]